MPRRWRGPQGPDAPERPNRPFDLPALALPIASPPAPSGTSVSGGSWPWWWRIVRAVLIGAATGGVALLVARPLAGLVVGAIVAVGLLVPWLRAAATVAGVAAIVAGCLNLVEGQRVHHYLPGSNWAGSFVNAGNLIWLGVVLLLADAVISSFGLRVPKPRSRRSFRAVASSKGEPTGPAETIPAG